MPGVEVGLAEVFVSHCWGAKFANLVSAVFSMCPDGTFVWMDMFAVMQHMKDPRVQNNPRAKEEAEEDLQFQSVIEKARAFLLVCNPDAGVGSITSEEIVRREASADVLDCLPPNRVWCCYEILHAVINKKPIVLQSGLSESLVADTATDDGATAADTTSASADALHREKFVHSSRDTILNMLQLVDIEHAKAKFEEDRTRILMQIKEEVGMLETNAIVKGAITGAMASIMSGGSSEGDFSAVPRSVISGSDAEILAAGYTKQQIDVAFSIATAGGFQVAMLALREQGADPNARTEGGDTALHWAAQGCQLAALTSLKELGADLGAENDVGWHAVMWASSNVDGFVASVRRLASLGMDVACAGSLNSTGGLAASALEETNGRLVAMTPLMWMVPAAFMPGITSLVEEHKVDVHAANGKGLTALHFAAAADKLPLLTALVKSFGADVDARMHAHGQTAAMWAARHGREATLAHLKECGANLELTDADGKDCAALLAAAKAADGGADQAAAMEALTPKAGTLGDPARTDVRAASYMWRLEGWLCL